MPPKLGNIAMLTAGSQAPDRESGVGTEVERADDAAADSGPGRLIAVWLDATGAVLLRTESLARLARGAREIASLLVGFGPPIDSAGRACPERSLLLEILAATALGQAREWTAESSRGVESTRWQLTLEPCEGAAPRTAMLRFEERGLESSTMRVTPATETLADFSLAASRDLREPLRVISAYTGLLEKRYAHVLDADAREYLSFTTHAAERMSCLLNDLLAFARLDNDVDPLATSDLGSALDNALANLDLAAAHADCVLEAALATSDELAIAPSHLVLIFENLIGNAIKFRSQHPPVVTIEAVRRDNVCRVEVQDNGIGFEPRHESRIFGLFQRLHGVHEYGGTGVGLAMCQRLVARYGGEIGARGVPGEGSAFWFELPTAG